MNENRPVKDPITLTTSDYRDNKSPNRADTWEYISLTQEDERRFLLNAYNYTGGFRTGQYLIPYPIEGHYNMRREFSVYTNYFGSIIDAMVKPVFNKDADRTISDKKGNQKQVGVWEMFVDDCTGGGISLSRFMMPVMTACRSTSTTYIVVDNFGVDEQPGSMNEAVEQRVFPYVYHRLPTSVYTFEKNRFGKLVSITFEEAKELNEKDEEVRAFIEWTETYSQKYHMEGNKLVPIGPPVEHGLGKLPVVVVNDADPFNSLELFPQPRMFGVGMLCYQLYNFESEMREMNRKCSFQMFAIQQDSGGDISGGNGQAVYVPLEASNMPQWISPDSEIVKANIEEYNRIQQNLYRLAQQNGVVGVRQAASGIALAYDFRAYRATLQETAAIAENAEKEIFDIFMRYMGIDTSGLNYSSGYDKEFMPHDIDARIGQDEFILDNKFPEKAKKMVKLDHIKMRFPEASEEEIQEIEKQLEEMNDEELENALDFAKNNDPDKDKGGDE